MSAPKYVTHFHNDTHPQWVTRIEHGPYVAYHYTQEAADILTAMLNERIEGRAALVEVDEILTEMGWHTDRGLLQRVRAAIKA